MAVLADIEARVRATYGGHVSRVWLSDRRHEVNVMFDAEDDTTLIWAFPTSEIDIAIISLSAESLIELLAEACAPKATDL